MVCISLPAAMLIGAGISGVGSAASSFIGSDAAKEAAKVQAAAAEKAAKTQAAAAEKAAKAQAAAAGKALHSSKSLYKSLAGEFKPYVDTGTDVGLTGVKNLLGGGDMNSNEIQHFLENTPGYKFALKQGLQAAQSGFAAKGLGQSGAAIKGAADYATGLASQTYNEIFGNFLSAAQMGSAAATNLGTLGSNFNSANNSLITGAATANAAGTIGAATANAAGTIGAANAEAGGIAGSANALTSGINSFANTASQGALTLGLNNAGFFDSAGGNGGTSSWAPDWWK